jgi:hypothetical protein
MFELKINGMHHDQLINEWKQHVIMKPHYFNNPNFKNPQCNFQQVKTKTRPSSNTYKAYTDVTEDNI